MPLLTLRQTKPELGGHGRSEFYIACQSIFDLRFLSPSLALMKQYWNSKVKDCPIIIWICCAFLLSMMWMWFRTTGYLRVWICNCGDVMIIYSNVWICNHWVLKSGYGNTAKELLSK